MPVLYFSTTVVAFISLILFIIISDKKVMFYNASFFIFVFLSNLGQLFIGLSSNVEEALMANKLTYISGCLLSLFLMMLVFDACKVNPNKWVRLGMYCFNITVMIISMTAGFTDWLYKECHIEKLNGVTILVKEYGPAHTLFLVMLYGYSIVGFSLLVYSLIKRKKIIYKNVILMIIQYIITLLCYTVGRKLLGGLDPLCVSYAVNSIILLFVTYNTGIYNLDEALLSSVDKQDSQGYLLFDKKLNYIGCNHVAEKFIPELEQQNLARQLNSRCSKALDKIEEMIKGYSGESLKESISFDGKDIEISVNYLYKSNKVRGYIVRIADDSKQQEYIRQLDMISTNKSNFLSNVSHEIRTPINAVLGMNEMILRECKDDNIREYAMNIASSGQTLLQLINDVLDLSKIESGKLEVIPIEYELADIIHELETMIRPLVKKDVQELKVEASPALPKKLYGDAIRVKQMVTNILTNAVKYTDKGTITFKIDGERDGENFIFRYTVSDTGRGIKESDMGSLFTAFERVDQRKNSGIEGTGLGLAITKKFAVMMGGDITVESTYGQGSVFTVTVPQKVIGSETMGDYRTGRHEKTRAEYTESFHAPEAKVLAVDDVKMNLTIITKLLKKTQIPITCVMSGNECIEAVKSEHFDIILLDHMMPELDGIDTLKILRDEHLCDDTPVIILTANADVDAKSNYLGAGFSDYLSKPINPAMLEQMIMEYLPEDKVIRQ
ncbi:MAG: ATP-binding protein [Oscillospiraceae bacterium]